MITHAFSLWIRTAVAVTVLASLGIVAFVFKESLPFWSDPETYRSLVSTIWYPRENHFGLISLIVGSLSVVGFAVVLSALVSLCAAVAIVFYLPRRVASFLLLAFEAAAGIPAVVIGLFGLLQLVPLLGSLHTPAFGLLVASCVLSLILIPTLTSNIVEVLVVEADEIVTVGKSLGISLETLILEVIWPARRHAVARSLFLATSRGLGETLAILMVAGNVVQIPTGPFESFRTINATIALEMPYALGVHRASLFAVGLVTLLLVLTLHFLAQRFTYGES